LDALRLLWKARAAIFSADVVHVEFGSNDLSTFWCAVWCCLLGCRIVMVTHDPPKVAHTPGAGLIARSGRWRMRLAYRVLSPALDRLLISVTLRRSRAIVVLSEAARRELQARTSRPVLAAPLGASRPSPRTVAPSRGEYVLFAGFLAPSKGIDVLVRAWEEVHSPPLPLAIAGAADPSQGAWLSALMAASTQSANPPRWLGPIASEQDFQALFELAAVVVLPYLRSSPASGILVRAMTAGRCVIATPVQAVVAAIEDGESGILVAPGDPHGLADALSRVLSDGAQRDRLGAEAARRAAELFSWDRFVARLGEAYALAERPA
jgi:glycosyltransferase involved in cell wall biosynthesis